MDRERLAERAYEASQSSFSPFSGYEVGAAIETESGEVFSACNVEVKPSSNILHAEQRAIAKAVEDGHRNFEKLALYTSGDDANPPCGNCRNALATIEYELEIIVAGADGEILGTWDLPNLLPHAYRGSRHENV